MAMSDPVGQQPDDLDALLDVYQAQAQLDSKAVQASRPVKKPKPSKRGPGHRLQQGLSTPLTSDNIGYKLMVSKMGYTAGSALGASGRGEVQPLPLHVKRGRLGLGIDEGRRRDASAREAQLQERRAQVAAEAERHTEKRARTNAAREEEFVASKQSAFQLRQERAWLHSARQICQTLDERQGTTAGRWRWLPVCPPEPGSDSCPSQAQESARLHRLLEGEASSSDAAISEEPLEPVDLRALLANCLAHLRGEHAYCLFCGCQYDDIEQLQAMCPGERSTDH